jgi:hypothetical protein
VTGTEKGGMMAILLLHAITKAEQRQSYRVCVIHTVWFGARGLCQKIISLPLLPVLHWMEVKTD